MTVHEATVTTKGQVTIPKEIRQTLGIREQDQLLFIVEGEHALMIPLRRRPLDDLFGALPTNRPYPGLETVRTQVRARLGERISRDEE